MAKAQLETTAEPRTPLSRDRVLRAAVALADREGIDALSMRRLAQELGVVPMALYKHVANKDELLDGMVDVVVGEIDPPRTGTDWKTAVRERILSARRALLRHPWASRVMESRPRPTPAVLAYMDSMIGDVPRRRFSVDLTHHVMHALGSRMMGFTQELFNDPAGRRPPRSSRRCSRRWPRHIPYDLPSWPWRSTHDDASVVGPGCDDQFEFEFALDLLLDGFERLKAAT